MSDAVLDETITSKFALYQGLIALAWADHDLHEDETRILTEIIDSHQGLTAYQRDQLHHQIRQPTSPKEIWPYITDPQDRARLIDMANIIFQQDGEFSINEKEVIERFTAAHLSSIQAGQIEADLDAFSDEQTERRKLEREELREYASKYSFMAGMKRMFGM